MAFQYPTDITNFTSLGVYFNNVTEGLFWTLALIGFTIVIIAFLNYFSDDTPAIFHSSALLSFIASILMYGQKWVSPFIVLAYLLLWALSIWYYKTQQPAF